MKEPVSLEFKRKKRRTKDHQNKMKEQNVTKACKPEKPDNILIPYKILVAAIRNAVKQRYKCPKLVSIQKQ